MVPIMVEYFNPVVLLSGEQPSAENIVIQPKPGDQVQLIEHSREQLIEYNSNRSTFHRLFTVNML